MNSKLSSAASITKAPVPSSATGKRRQTKKRKKRFVRFVSYMLIVLLVLAGLSAGWLFLTPSGTNFRYLVADTLITTQHRYLAKYIIGQKELDRRVAEYQKEFDAMGDEKDNHTIHRPIAGGETNGKNLVEIEPISGEGYKGYLMIVHDPTKIRLGVPSKPGRGEQVLSMVNQYGAIAGVNAGGFADPNWHGNGFQPIGLVISQGKIYYNDAGKTTQIVGIDNTGKMVAGRYTLKQIEQMGVEEAVTFQPRIIVNGKGLIKSPKDGWGIAPRTAMGQREDGSILFLVIDGRQPGYSIGANLYDVQQIMLKHGAVIAANLDGGSSTMLVKDGNVMNKPSTKDPDGRYLPTAWLVFDNPEQANIPNIWQGLRPQDIDPAKW